MCDIGLNPSLRKINVNTVKHVLLYRINSSCKLLLIIIIHVNNDVIIIRGIYYMLFLQRAHSLLQSWLQSTETLLQISVAKHCYSYKH